MKGPPPGPKQPIDFPLQVSYALQPSDERSQRGMMSPEAITLGVTPVIRKSTGLLILPFEHKAKGSEAN